MKRSRLSPETPLPPVAIFDDYWATSLTFARSLGRKGVPLHFYGSGAGQFSRYRTRRSGCPPVADAGRFLPWLQGRIRSGEIGRIAPTTDLIAYYSAYLRDEFREEVRRAIPPLPEVEKCLFKTRFAESCRQVGQATPQIAAPDDPGTAQEAAAAIGFPLILKPKSHLVVGTKERGHLIGGARDLRFHYRQYRVAPGQEQLAEWYPELRWPLLQRYQGPGRNGVYSVTGLKDAAQGFVATSLSFKREQWPAVVGVSTVQRSCGDAGLLDRGLGAVDKLISRGLFELELITDGAELQAIDLNPRAFGFLALDVARGRDLPWLWLRTTMEAVEPLAVPACEELVEARNTVVRLLHGRRGLTRRRLREAGGAADEKVRSIGMVGYWSDPVPMLLSNFHAVQSVLRHRVRSMGRRVGSSRLGAVDPDASAARPGEAGPIDAKRDVSAALPVNRRA